MKNNNNNINNNTIKYSEIDLQKRPNLSMCSICTSQFILGNTTDSCLCNFPGMEWAKLYQILWMNCRGSHLVRANGFTLLSNTYPRSWRKWFMIHTNTFLQKHILSQSPWLYCVVHCWYKHYVGMQTYSLASYSFSKLPDLTKTS